MRVKKDLNVSFESNDSHIFISSGLNFKYSNFKTEIFFLVRYLKFSDEMIAIYKILFS